MSRLLLAALLACAAVPARAAFEDTGAGARGPGLGEAFTGLADDVYAIHYNPAGLAQLERPQLGAAYSRLYVGLSDGSDIGTSQIMYAHPWARGRKGTFGLGLNRFSLGGLYTEQTIALSYARKTFERDSGSQLLTGFNFKQLSRSFSKTPEASASCSGLNCSGGVDPVLSGKTSASTMDMDLGFLYRFPRRFQLGVAVQHLMSPNVGFAGTDKLERAINLGLAYKSLWLSLMGEVKMRKGAGGTERDMILAAERFFPTLDFGQFGVRGSLGVGANDYRQVSMGFAYRVNKVQADYAFILPVGAVKGHSGTHRIGLTFHFGAPTADEEISRELLEQAKKLRENGPDYGYEYSEELKPQTLDDPRLANIRQLIAQRKYRAAHKALVEFAQRQPLSPPLIRLANRLDLIAGYFPDVPEVQTKFDQTLVASIERFLRAEDRLAMLQMSYAFSMKTEDARLNKMLDDMEKGVGLKAEKLPADHPRGFMEELLYRVELSNTRGDAGKVESQLMDILAIEPDNVTALLRLGSLRYVQSRYLEAIQTWEAAMPLEKRERELESLREYLRLAKERAGSTLPGGVIAPPVLAPAPAPAAIAPIDALPAPIDGAGAQIPAAVSPAPAVPLTGAPAVTLPPSPAATAAPASPPPAAVIKAKAPSGDPRDVERLYQKGVEHYARGEYLQATAMFIRILQIDPENAQARKALERIDRRRPRR